MKRLIVTADDFGLAVPINEAVERAHREGILTSASLMVGAAHADDAVRRARALPDLRVGLHLVVVEGRPTLPAADVPHLVDDSGELDANLVRAGVRFFFDPRARAELAREIRAQFEAYRETGLALDHVDVHVHMHLHPTVATLLFEIGSEYGMPAVRIPSDARGDGWLAPWLALLRRRVQRAGLRCNDAVLGLRETGAMNEATVLRLLADLPDGVTEMYFHPATQACAETRRHMPGYLHEDEFHALRSAHVRDAVARSGAVRVAYGDL